MNLLKCNAAVLRASSITILVLALLADSAVAQKVSIPAGEFEALKLAAKGSLHGMSPINSVYAGETTATYWYAPTARAIVKSVTHNPYLGVSTVELVEFQLRP